MNVHALRKILMGILLVLVANHAMGREVFGTSAARMVKGQSKALSGAQVTTWARNGSDGQIFEVGVTVPMAVINHPPAKEGDGPAGAIASIKFPDSVVGKTYFDHFEMQWNPKGHPPHCFMVPHFDFHFYGVPEAEVWDIKALDPAPAREFIPAGYVWPGADTFVPEMGEHTADPAELAKPFTAIMIAGFNKSRMHFIEPMITQKFLQRKKTFTLEVPKPAKHGRNMLYPTKFVGQYDETAKAYHLVFSEFKPVS